MDISGSRLDEIEQRFDVVVANIVHDILLALADDLSRLVMPGGTLVLSGLIHGEQTESIGRCFLERDFCLVEQAREKEWGALRLEKKEG